MKKQRPPAPKGTYWHRNVLWGQVMINRRRYRWSLHTSDLRVAAERRQNDLRPFDMATLWRKLAEILTPSELDFVVEAIDAREFRERRGRPPSSS
jgi:hypothetical protein